MNNICPFCSTKVDYFSSVAKEVDSTAVGVQDSRPYHNDGNYFINCPKCKEPILLEQVSELMGGGLQIALNQQL